jgi:hypothetical protein
MTSQKRIVATLAGGVTAFLMGWILYGMAFVGFFSQHYLQQVERPDDQMVWWALFAGNVMYAYLLAYLFPKWEGNNSFVGGFKSGAMIALILGYAVNLTMYGTSGIMDLTATLVDPLVFGLMMGVSGGVIGWIYGRG